MSNKATFLIVCTTEDPSKLKLFSEMCRASFPVRIELGASVFIIGSAEHLIREIVVTTFHGGWPKAVVAVPWKFPDGFYHWELEEEDKKILIGLQGEYLIERARANGAFKENEPKA